MSRRMEIRRTEREDQSYIYLRQGRQGAELRIQAATRRSKVTRKFEVKKDEGREIVTRHIPRTPIASELFT